MVINFFGRRGTGKTTTIKGQLQDCRPPIVIVDILGNYSDERYLNVSNIPQAIEGMQRFVKGDQAARVISLRTSDPTGAADYMSAALWQIEGGTLVLDEVDSIRITQGSCFDEFIRYGRNHNCDLLTGCRRPAELDRNVTAAANKFYCFQTHEWRDIEYFKNSVFGETAEKLITLPKFSGMFLNHDNGMVGTFTIDVKGRIYHTSESFV